ncbi:MAG: DegT/DnrJ/EryC1/StrS family aminotransferase [Candidatus Rariloculaceae bacterium]
MTVPFLDLHAQYESIKDEIDLAIGDVVATSSFVGGKYVDRFEKQFASYQQSEYCVGVGNGTDALEIAIEALQMPAGEILVPANSFIASSEAVTRGGHDVVFCDVDPTTYTVDLIDAQTKVSDRSVAIMPVHLYGQPCDMDSVLEFASKHGLRVIEDCAQAHGAEWMSRRVGSFGDLATFSFYPGKNLGAYGDAGAVLTDDAELAARVRMIANHGRLSKFAHELEGRNSRLDGLQASILSAKLPHLESWTERRREVARAYRQRLQGVPNLILPGEVQGSRHVYHLFVIRTMSRDALQAYLRERGIQTGVHYPVALPKLDAYSRLRTADEEMFANRSDSELLSLPIGEHISEQDVAEVSEAIVDYLSKDRSL